MKAVTLKASHTISRNKRELHLIGFCLFLIASGFIFNSPKEIYIGLYKIMTSPSNLITDYMKLTNIGATLVNSGLTTLLTVFLLKVEKVDLTGPIIAGLLNMSGFALFGKNLFNTIPIAFGVFLYVKIMKINFNQAAPSSLFATALGPLVSEISFAYGFTPVKGIVFGYLAGIVIGFVFKPLADNCSGFYKNYNLFNAGFTAGLLGMFATGILRMFNIKVETVSIISEGNNLPLFVWLMVLFAAIFIVGVFVDGYYPGRFKLLMKHSGYLASNWVQVYGYGTVLMNMAIMGIVSTLYVVILGGELNGATIGGIFAVTGFSAYGVHLRNTLPIYFGVYLASVLNIYDPHSTAAMLAALFGTALVPLSGTYGPYGGILAGFSHMAMVMNVGYLHGGMNLYNNGFSSGFVAATLYPIFNAYKQYRLMKKNDLSGFQGVDDH